MQTTIDLVCVGAQDARITGTEIASAVFGLADVPAGEVWSKLTLLEESNGDWIVVRQRNIPNYDDLVGEYAYFTRSEVSTHLDGFDGLPSTEAAATQQLVDRTMRWLDWSFLAKQLAASQGWNVVKAVGNP